MAIASIFSRKKLHLSIFIKTNSASACWRLPPGVFRGSEAIAKNKNFLEKSTYPQNPSNNMKSNFSFELSSSYENCLFQTSFTYMVYPYAVAAFRKRFQSFNKLIKPLFIDQQLKYAVLHAGSVIQEQICNFGPRSVIGNIVGYNHKSHSSHQERLIFLPVENSLLDFLRLDLEKPAIACLRVLFPVKKGFFHPFFIVSQKLFESFLIQEISAIVFFIKVLFFYASIIDHGHDKPINYRMAELLYPVKGKRLPALLINYRIL